MIVDRFVDRLFREIPRKSQKLIVAAIGFESRPNVNATSLPNDLSAPY